MFFHLLKFKLAQKVNYNSHESDGITYNKDTKILADYFTI